MLFLKRIACYTPELADAYPICLITFLTSQVNSMNVFRYIYNNDYTTCYELYIILGKCLEYVKEPPKISIVDEIINE